MPNLKNTTVKNIRTWRDDIGFRVAGDVIFDQSSVDPLIVGNMVQVTVISLTDESLPVGELSKYLTCAAMKVMADIAAEGETAAIRAIDADWSEHDPG